MNTPTLSSRLANALRFRPDEFQKDADKIDLLNWFSLPKSHAAICARYAIERQLPVIDALIAVVSAAESGHGCVVLERGIGHCEICDKLADLSRAIEKVESDAI